MKPTGKTNPITGEPFMVAEVFDVAWTKAWEDLNEEERVTFLSFAGIGLFNKEIEPMVKQRFNELKSYFGYK